MNKIIILKKGQKVYWNDPAGETSGTNEVLTSITLEDMEDDSIVLIGNGDTTEAQVYIWELELEKKVLFRKFKEKGAIIALFPEDILPDYQIGSYMHIGQHSGADYDHIIWTTTRATEQEYKPLLDELTNNVGYHNLRVMKKCRPKFD